MANTVKSEQSTCDTTQRVLMPFVSLAPLLSNPRATTYGVVTNHDVVEEIRAKLGSYHSSLSTNEKHGITVDLSNVRCARKFYWIHGVANGKLYKVHYSVCSRTGNFEIQVIVPVVASPSGPSSSLPQPRRITQTARRLPPNVVDRLLTRGRRIASNSADALHALIAEILIVLIYTRMFANSYHPIRAWATRHRKKLALKEAAKRSRQTRENRGRSVKNYRALRRALSAACIFLGVVAAAFVESELAVPNVAPADTRHAPSLRSMVDDDAGGPMAPKPTEMEDASIRHVGFATALDDQSGVADINWVEDHQRILEQ
ncbi:MAG TPA: hypothetical protein VN807_05845 [Candidatus Sulfotelmatobacter sp.]|nr:hypothetical protein [Candidatus Sulfotelmatobacter sp.]